MHYVCPASLGRFFWLLTSLANIDDYLCEAIRWGYNSNLKLLSELLHDADMKLFRSMLHRTHCIHQLIPHWICANKTALLTHFSSPLCDYNLYKHSFYDVFLMEHINYLCRCLAYYSLLFIFHVFPFFILIFFLSFLFPVMLYYSYRQTFSHMLLYSSSSSSSNSVPTRRSSNIAPHCWYSYCVILCAPWWRLSVGKWKLLTYLRQIWSEFRIRTTSKI